MGEKLGYSGSCVLNVFLLFTAAVEQDDTSGLVIEVFDDLDEGSTYMVYSDPQNWTLI